MAYEVFDTPAIAGNPNINDLAQADSEMVPPPAIPAARLLQVLDDSS
ncbi:hypothetical protein [Actinomadura coerulea]